MKKYQSKIIPSKMESKNFSVSSLKGEISTVIANLFLQFGLFILQYPSSASMAN